MLVWVGLFDELEVVVFGVAAGPRFVPMEAGAPSILRSFWVIENRVCAVRNEVTVVVPNDDFLVSVTGRLHGGSEVVFQEVTLLFSGVNARFPALSRHGFVLDGHPPNGKAFRFVGFDELDKVIGPGLVVFRQKGAAAQHVLVRFHKGGRAPWARVKHQVFPDHGSSTLDHWNALCAVGFDVERGQG